MRNAKNHLAVWLKRFPFLRWGLALGVRLFAPKNYVGVMAVIFNDEGKVLLAQHVFRPDYPWGLPGGWVERGEDPVLAVQRELQEELNLKVEVRRILFCVPQGEKPDTTTPPGLALAYYCRVADDVALPLEQMGEAKSAFEVLAAEWVDPTCTSRTLNPIHVSAIELGHQEYKNEQRHH